MAPLLACLGGVVLVSSTLPAVMRRPPHLVRIPRRAGIALVVGALGSVSAVWARPRPVVIDAAGGCPDSELIAAQLAPLLEGEPQGERLVVTVRDEGDRYEVVVGSERRSVEDPTRDCLERARVAAVFIALNVPGALDPSAAPAPPAAAPPPAPPPPPVPPSAPARLPAAERAAPLPELCLFTALTAAADAPLVAPGLGMGVGLASRRARAAVYLGAHSAVSVPEESGAGRAELLRFPVLLHAGPRFERGRWELSPFVGLGLDVLGIRGRALPGAADSVRLDPALAGGVATQLRAGPRVRGLFAVDLGWHPRVYTLRVAPTEDLGTTPHVWATLRLGLAVGPRRPDPQNEGARSRAGSLAPTPE